ncbi:hypothetical protein B0H13DRAFT_2572425 [Mycena leptocephala]|nr:hypothetical protein B0H13DRAFT_2572425 [Mycena leptocephala]
MLSFPRLVSVFSLSQWLFVLSLSTLPPHITQTDGSFARGHSRDGTQLRQQHSRILSTGRREREERHNHLTPHIFRVARSGWSGELPNDLLSFLQEWRDSPPGNQTHKGRKRGELAQMRSALRAKWPNYQVNLNMIKEALYSKPEWTEWAEELYGERQAKLEKRREAKALRKDSN